MSVRWSMAFLEKRESMTLHERQITFAKNVATLIGYIFLKDYQMTFGEAYRTPEQAELNAKKGTGIKDSLHCQRLALDINLFKNDKYLTDTQDYEFLGVFWESLNKSNRWGGRFSNKDGNHFEMMLKERDEGKR